MSDYWINIEFSEETGEKLEKARLACHKVHTYTLEELNNYFIFHAENYMLSYFRRELTIFLKKNKQNLMAQHYSLVKAAEKTFPYFSEHKKINRKGKFTPVQPVPEDSYRKVYIETRQVWRKYLALNNLITTGYGTIYLDEEKWAKIVAEQATQKGIGFDAVSFYWYNATLHIDLEKGSKIRFGLRELSSKVGKRTKKELSRQHE